MARPRKEDGESGTTLIRIFDEMYEKVKDLLLVLPQSTAQIMQRVGGRDLKELHDTYLPQIEKAKAAKHKADEAMRKAREEVEQMEKGSQVNDSRSARKSKPES